MVLWCFKKKEKQGSTPLLLNRRTIHIIQYRHKEKFQRLELWRKKAEELTSLVNMKKPETPASKLVPLPPPEGGSFCIWKPGWSLQLLR